MATNDIPLIDISGFSTASWARKLSIANEVRRACEDIGLFTIVGHGIPEELLETTSELVREFFDLPLHEKNAVPAKYTAGYTPYLQENMSGMECMPKEAFNVIEDKMQGQWPARPREFRETLTAYFAAMVELAKTLTRVTAVALERSENAFDDRFTEHLSFLRLVNYPDQEQLPKTARWRCEPHRDLGTLTIIKNENRPGGLQVHSRDRGWLDVHSAPGALVVNTGDELSRWTNGAWVSAMHQVANPPPEQRLDSRRLSMIFFHNPDSMKEIRNSYLESLEQRAETLTT